MTLSTGKAGEPRRDLGEEQAYLDRAYHHLAAMVTRTSAAAEDAAERAKADWNAEVARARLVDRLSSLTDDTRPLCFGRIDEGGQPLATWYIGRRHVEDPDGAPVVVDWRAPVAIPFYRATLVDPQGLKRRRRFILEGRELVDLLDESFEEGDVETMGAAGLPDPLLAELGRARSGPMRDIVATIAAEQDRIIRASLRDPLIVQGGPGTGKTAVGLHRAAYLLYEHRQVLTRQGVLIIGPNKRFLAYISEVLPSLGEVAVVQTTLSGLVPALSVRGEDSDATARVKGDLRMAEVLARAATGAIGGVPEELVASSRWGTVRLSKADVETLLEDAVSSGGPVGLRRTRFRRALHRRIAAELTERRGPAVIGGDEVAADLRGDRAFQRAIDQLWPGQSAVGLVRSLLGRAPLLRQAGAGVLSSDEMALLARRPAAKVAEERWTEADLVLIDEAGAVLGDSPRRYGHIIVDEAQDLSALAWRMVGRRSADGRSITVLGDLAQSTASAGLHDWSDVIGALGHPEGASVAELSVGYRVPRPIMDFANRLLPLISAELPVTDSIRPWGDPPLVLSPPSPEAVLKEVIVQVERLGAVHQSVAVIAHADRLPELTPVLDQLTPSPTLLAPSEAKGLEFDAVVVIEPGEVFEQDRGAGLLYIALTRAVQELCVISGSALPDALAA